MNANDRRIYAEVTHIDRFIIDHVVSAFDALIERDDPLEYRRRIRYALAHQGIPSPIPEKEKPTAVDRIKAECVVRYADRLHIPPERAVKRLKKMMAG